MLKIYGADLSTPANKVRFTANYLGLAYEYLRVRIKDGDHRKEAFLKLNPAGKIPVMDDEGFVLFESNAISKYLCRKQKSALYPENEKQRAVIDQWIDFVSIHIGSAVNRVLFNRIFAHFAKVPVDERSLQDGLNFLNRFLPVVDNRLSRGSFLAGEEMSLADINLLATLDPAAIAEIDISVYPNLAKWQKTLKKKAFYQQCHGDYGAVLKRMRA